MPLIIDGYNLLYAAGVVGHGKRGGSLQRSREALLRLLASSIDDADRPRTTIVFDAAEAPPGLPRVTRFAEMTVRYAANYADADALIEELIRAESAPRSLLVVSSDHRVQRAARRRRARAIDSDLWYADIVRKRARQRRATPRPAKPSGRLSEAEVAYWLQELGLDQPPDGPTAAPPPESRSWDSPFPPGYGEDLL